MKQFKTLSIKKAIQSSLGKTKAEKYFRDSEIKGHEEDLMELYNTALSKLSSGQMVDSINIIVFALDVDMENKFFFSLAKSIVVMLDKELDSNKSNKIKQKYTSSFENIRGAIKARIDSSEKNISSVSQSLERIEKDLYESRPSFFSLTKLFITYKLKESKFKPRVRELKMELSEYEGQIQELEVELKDVERLSFIEECFKVLSLTMEICIFPARFNTKS